jgi:hypothetical protein
LLKINMTTNETDKWAFAIAERISDEWNGKDVSEDRELLRSVLYKTLRKCPDEMKKLIGTTVIEA